MRVVVAASTVEASVRHAVEGVAARYGSVIRTTYVRCGTMHVGIAQHTEVPEVFVSARDGRVVVLDGWLRADDGALPADGDARAAQLIAASEKLAHGVQFEGLLTIVDEHRCTWWTDSTLVAPAFWAAIDGGAVWATALSPVVAATGRRQLSTLGASATLITGSWRPPWSLVDGICSARAGRRHDVDAAGVRSTLWYRRRLERSVFGATQPTAMRGMLGEALRVRLDTAERPASLLSAGLDSYLLAAIAAIDLDRKVTTFTFRYDREDAPWNEHTVAAERAAALGLDHHVIDMTMELFVSHFHDYVAAYDAPFTIGAHSASISTIAEYGHDVLVSGFEVEEYYESAVPSVLRLLMSRLPTDHLVRRSIDLGRAQCTGTRDTLRRLYEYAVAGVRTRNADAAALQQLLGDGLPTTLASAHRALLDDVREQQGEAWRDQVSFVDDVTWWASAGHYWVHRWCRSARMSARLPFEDTRIERYLAAHLRRGPDRQVFRQVLDDVLGAPTPVPKYGQRIPLDEWMRSDLGDLVGELLASSDGLGVWDPSAATRLLDEHRKGVADRGQILLALGSLVAFHRASLA